MGGGAQNIGKQNSLQLGQLLLLTFSFEVHFGTEWMAFYGILLKQGAQALLMGGGALN